MHTVKQAEMYYQSTLINLHPSEYSQDFTLLSIWG